MKEINLLWADREHPDIFKGTFMILEKEHLLKTETVDSPYKWEEEILNKSGGKDVLLIHRGAMSVDGTRELIESVRRKEPNIKIALLANAKHQILEDVVDFYVSIPLEIDEFYEVIKNHVG